MFDNENHLIFILTIINAEILDLKYIYIKYFKKQNVARLKNIFIKINLFEISTLKDIYVFYVKLNLHSLFYKKHLISNKYINELFHFDIFNLISNIDIRLNYRMMFKFIKNVNKRFYIHFDAYKNETLNIFKLFKINIKHNDFIIKHIHNDKNIIIKNQIFNNFKYNYKIN